MAIKTVDTVRQALIDQIKNAQPNITTRVGSVVRDVFITPLAEELGELYTELSFVQAAQSPVMAEGDGLLNLAANLGIRRIGASKAQGSVTFFTPTAPVNDITIPAGTVVQTTPDSSNKVYRFVTLQTGIIYKAQAATYLNTVTGNYEITVAAIAEKGGITYNVASNSISRIQTTITGIAGVYNSAEFTGGTDQETLSALRSRVLAFYNGISLGSSAGYYRSVLGITNVLDAKVVGPDSVYMQRKYAGGLDIYIKGIVPVEAIQQFTIADGMAPELVVANQPVIRDYGGTLVSTNGTEYIYGTDWTWTRDTGVKGASVQGRDRIQWLITPTANLQTVTLYYTYNSLINTVQNYLNGDDKHVIGADILAKWASPLTINVGCRIRISSGYVFTTVKASVETALSTLFSGYLLGQQVQQSDIIAAINNTIGVEDVVSPLDTLVDADGDVSADAYGNITIPFSRYAILGTVTITQIG